MQQTRYRWITSQRADWSTGRISLCTGVKARREVSTFCRPLHLIQRKLNWNADISAVFSTRSLLLAMSLHSTIVCSCREIISDNTFITSGVFWGTSIYWWYFAFRAPDYRLLLPYLCANRGVLSQQGCVSQKNQQQHLTWDQILCWIQALSLDGSNLSPECWNQPLLLGQPWQNPTFKCSEFKKSPKY